MDSVIDQVVTQKSVRAYSEVGTQNLLTINISLKVHRTISKCTEKWAEKICPGHKGVNEAMYLVWTISIIGLRIEHYNIGKTSPEKK